MKFTKEQLLDTLKAKLTANGKHLSISEKTIKNLSDSHYELLVNEETELEDLVGKILPQYVSLNGNYEKDNADFIKKWKDEHPDTPPKDSDDKDAKVDPNVEKLLERISALEAKNAENEVKRIVSQKHSELLSGLKEKGIKDDKWIEAYIKKITLSKDSDMEKETRDALDFYNLSHAGGGGGTPGKPANENAKDYGADRWAGVNKYLGADSGSGK